jgi:hypothetical protein
MVIYNEENVIGCTFYPKGNSSDKYIILGEKSMRKIGEETLFSGWSLFTIANNFNNGSWIVISSPKLIHEVW